MKSNVRSDRVCLCLCLPCLSIVRGFCFLEFCECCL